MARRECATENLSVILWRLWNAFYNSHVRGRPFYSERGGGGEGLTNFVETDYLFSAWTRLENLNQGPGNY